MTYEQDIEKALQIAREAGELALRYFGQATQTDDAYAKRTGLAQRPDHRNPGARRVDGIQPRDGNVKLSFLHGFPAGCDVPGFR